MDKNIVFFDIETKQLIPSNGDLSGLEIAIAGVRHGSNDFFFHNTLAQLYLIEYFLKKDCMSLYSALQENHAKYL